MLVPLLMVSLPVEVTLVCIVLFTVLELFPEELPLLEEFELKLPLLVLLPFELVLDEPLLLLVPLLLVLLLPFEFVLLLVLLLLVPLEFVLFVPDP